MVQLVRRFPLMRSLLCACALWMVAATGCDDSGTTPEPEPTPTPEPAPLEPETDGGPRVDAGAEDSGVVEPEPSPAPEGPGVEPDQEPAAEPEDAGVDAGIDAGPLLDAGLADDAGPLPCGGGCVGGFACCNDVCTDLTASPEHCGACGNACSLDEFCGGEPLGCHTAQFSNLCLVNRPYQIDDGEAADITSGEIIAEAVQSACPDMEQLVIRSQTDPTALEAGTGRPITGVNSLVILAGGSFFHDAVAYLEGALDLPVIAETTENTERLHRRGGGAIVDIPKAAVTPSHDFFVIQVADEAISGTLTLSAYGMFTPGTRAGAFWLATEVLPNLPTITEQYFIYEWTDGNGDEIPNAGDAFDLIFSG